MSVVKKNLLYIFSLAIIFYSFISLYKILITTAPDFSVYYHAGLDVLAKHSLYKISSFTIFNYPPITAFVFVPFAFLPDRYAQTIFILLSYISIPCIVWLGFYILNKKLSLLSFVVTLSLFLLSFPTKFTLGMGQSNLVAYALFLIAAVLTIKTKPVLAGILLAISIIFKPILVFGILYFIFGKNWKTIEVSIITGLSLIVLEVLFFQNSLHEYQTYFTSILPHLMTVTGREVYYNQGLLGTISRVIQNFQSREILNWIGAGIILFDVIKNLIQTNKHVFRLALLLCTLPLLDSLSWQHHFVVLFFPFLFTYYHLKNSKVTLGLLVVSYILVSSNIKTPTHLTQLPNNILYSHVFWGTLLLWALILYAGKRLQRSK